MQSPLRDFEFRADIADPHPATNGHFAGNPLIPGVVILEYVRVALTQLDADLVLQRFNRVKFTSPLKPGNQLIVRLSSKDSRLFRFSCVDAGQSNIASGEFSAQRNG
jgi:3-hydroxyacyl-[acyl-carrier-protein] dehydratase